MVRFRHRFLNESEENTYSKGNYIEWLEKKFEESLTKTHRCQTCNKEIDATVKLIGSQKGNNKTVGGKNGQ